MIAPRTVLGGFFGELLVLWSAAGAAGPAFSGNPYRHIPERNVFGLRPPQPAHLEPPPAPLPKVVLTGITTIFGDKRALLKVQFPARSPRPAKEQSCILAEGQRDGSVEVLKINEKTAKVKVDNAGTVMEITFEKPSPAHHRQRRAAPRRSWPRLSMRPVIR